LRFEGELKHDFSFAGDVGVGDGFIAVDGALPDFDEKTSQYLVNLGFLFCFHSF
jgi:hypothetical protein